MQENLKFVSLAGGALYIQMIEHPILGLNMLKGIYTTWKYNFEAQISVEDIFQN